MMEDAELRALQGREINPNDYDLLSSLTDVPKSEQTMPQILFDTLPVVMESEGSARTCTVCACTLAGSKVTLLPCGCMEKSPIHQQCLQAWVV